MSLAEFSSALKNKAIKEWFTTEKSARDSQRLANVNTLVNPTSDYRSAEQTAEKTSFIITKDTVRDLLVDMHGMVPGSQELSDLTDITFGAFKFKGVGAKVNRRSIKVGEGIPAVYFSTISFDTITTLVNNILNLKPGELAAKYEKGHVVGLNTELLRVTAGRIASIDARGGAGSGAPTGRAKEIILAELNNVIEYYKKLDYDSANIQPAADVPVYASVNKTINKTGKTKYLVELQTKAANQGSAAEVKATIGSIRKLFTPGALTDKAMAALIDKLVPSVSDPKFQQDLLNLKSSPSFIDMIAIQVAAAISGKPIDQNYSHSNVPIGKQPVPKVDLTEVRKLAKAELAKLATLKKKLTVKVAPIRSIEGQFYSLASLQTLINQNLPHVIAANMGSGTDTKVLNYRTGRFATSVQVERMTQSRDGMISAYYNYMKNPYATFSDGGKQQYPKTRDPKLLIAQSIKEIAATKVANRMRAVVI
jgi:hypothetical protein